MHLNQHLRPREKPKTSISFDVFEVVLVESNDSGADGTCGQCNQDIER